MSKGKSVRKSRRMRAGNPTDLIRTYLRDISRTELLTVDEERKVTRTIVESRNAIWECILRNNFFALGVLEAMRDYSQREVVAGLLTGIGGNAKTSRKAADGVVQLRAAILHLSPLFDELVRKNAKFQQCGGEQCNASVADAISEILKAFAELGVSWRFLDSQQCIVQKAIHTFYRLRTKARNQSQESSEVQESSGQAEERLRHFLLEYGCSEAEFARFAKEYTEVIASIEDSKVEIAAANTRLVVSVARTFVNRGMSLLDLIQEGNIGLLVAVEGYDPRAKTRFSTYATYWIKQQIKRALPDSQRQVHIPAYIINALGKLNAEERRRGRRLNDEEAALYLGMTFKQITLLRQATKQEQSLDGPWKGSDNDASPVEQLIAPVTATSESSLMAQRIQRALRTLDERTATVIRLRFGLSEEYGKSLTLKAVGGIIGLTRERVRQIEAEGLAAIRSLDPELEFFIPE